MGLSGYPRVCVVKAAARRVCHLQSHNASTGTFLSQIYTGVGRCTQSDITTLISKTLRDAVDFLGSNIRSLPGNVYVSLL
jgi:hypothetical protein